MDATSGEKQKIENLATTCSGFLRKNGQMLGDFYLCFEPFFLWIYGCMGDFYGWGWVFSEMVVANERRNSEKILLHSACFYRCNGYIWYNNVIFILIFAVWL